jgi:dTDP-4-dehydrorhamnose 3,5-epimerase
MSSPGAGPEVSAMAVEKIAERDGLTLAIKAGGTRGIGSVIMKAGDPNLIDGVQVAAFPFWPDDRGYFLEVVRLDGNKPEEIAAGFTETTQVSTTLSYPGTIKAIHYHCRQTDLWVPSRGMFQVFLYDLRVGSPTFGRVNTLYVGTLRAWKVRIPPGVGHGYKVLGNEAAMLVYVTNRFYDPQDEGRIPHDHPDINYDWELQFK